MATERQEVEAGLAMIPRAGAGMIAVAQQREIAETQSKMIVARMNPRDRRKALDRILQECTRESLAAKALYTYARGGTDITGESIRLAEVMAQNWGNFEFGIRELEQRDGESIVEAYAWDLETNVAQRKTFHVPHLRYSREKGNVKLSDPRDIYEMVANQGARRMRACILGVIPGDVREAAVKQCEETLRTKVTVTPERIKNILTSFGELGVTKEMIEGRIQRHIEAITPALIVQLTKIYNSLRDGMSAVEDWFDRGADKGREAEKGKLDIGDLRPGKAEEAAPTSKKATEAPKTKAAPAGTAKASGKPEAARGASYAEGDDGDPFRQRLFPEREPGEEG